MEQGEHSPSGQAVKWGPKSERVHTQVERGHQEHEGGTGRGGIPPAMRASDLQRQFAVLVTIPDPTETTVCCRARKTRSLPRGAQRSLRDLC